jgi:hypothetical protein
MKMRGLKIIVFAMLLFSCKGKQNKKNILPVSSMKLIMWDILKADEWYAQTAIRDTLHKRLNENFQIYEQVYKIHHVSKEQFYTSYKFYETHPDQFKILIDSVIAVGDRDKVIDKSGPTPIPKNPK